MVCWRVYISIKRGGHRNQDAPGSNWALIHSWMKTHRMSGKVEQPGSTAPPHLSLPSLYHTTLKLCIPTGYLATWHLALICCQATGARNHNTRPIPLLSSHLPLSLSFHSSHLRSLPSSSQYFIWKLTLHQPLYWSMITNIFSFLLFSLSFSTVMVSNHA